MGLITVLMECGIVLVAVVGANALKTATVTPIGITRFILAFILTIQFTQNLVKATTLMYNETVYDNTIKSVDSITGEPVCEPPRFVTPAVASSNSILNTASNQSLSMFSSTNRSMQAFTSSGSLFIGIPAAIQKA